jgi:hypothetical protein
LVKVRVIQFLSRPGRLSCKAGQSAVARHRPALGGDLVPDPREVSEARWVRPAEFLRLERTFAGAREFFA